MKMVMIMTEVFQFLIKQSISISYVIIFVMIVRFILKRFPKKYAYALWIIVAIPLLIPWHIESEFTLHPKMETTMTEMLIAPSIAKDTEDSTDMVNNNRKPVDETMPYITKKAQEEPLWKIISIYIWAIGILTLFIKNGMAYVHLKKRLASSIVREPGIYQSDVSGTPFVFGILHPAIYLPADISDQEAKYIILHEQMHIKRKDYLMKIFAYCLTVMYWFHPLVWLAYILMGKDMEMSCDEAVINKYQIQKKAYAQTLLSFACEKSQIQNSVVCFGEGNIKERIKNVLKLKKMKVWLSIVLIFIIIAIGIGLWTTPKQKDKQWTRQDEHYVSDIYQERMTPFDQWVSKLDYGDTFSYEHCELSDKDGMGQQQLLITMNTTQDLSYEHFFTLQEEGLKQNAAAILALQQPVHQVIYHLKHDNQELMKIYTKNSEDIELEDVDTYQKIYDEELQAMNQKLTEQELQQQKELFQSLSAFVPEKYLAQMNTAKIETVDNVKFYMFGNYASTQDKNGSYMYRYNIQIHSNDMEIKHFVFKNYEISSESTGNKLSDQQAQQLVDNFVKTYRKDASQLSFQKEAISTQHIYDPGHVESWVAHPKQDVTFVIMVDVDKGQIIEASFERE